MRMCISGFNPSMHAFNSSAVLQQYCNRSQVSAAVLHAVSGRPSSTRCKATATSVGSQPNAQAQSLHETHDQVISGTVSLYAISDLHTDYAANLSWVQQLDMSSRAGSSSSSSGRGADTSVLIIAGDISDDVSLIRSTLECLVHKFSVVAFVPGNHELWVKGGSAAAVAQRNGGATDSIEKLHRVLQLCAELGVVTQPTAIGALLLVPLLAWHHQGWDKEADIAAIPRASAMTIADYAACKWPADFPGATQLGAAATAAWFDAANESDIQQPGWTLMRAALQGKSSSSSGLPHVVSFSHFLPHQALLPEKRFLAYPNLAKAVGSDFLQQRLQQLHPNVHVFGHSHFAWDQEVQGVRCIQAPLCYPAERLHRVKSIILHNVPSAHQQTPQQSRRSSSSGGSDGGSSNSSSKQQPHPLHVGLQGHYAQHVEWLPVKIYEAHYTAELQTLDQQQQQQQGHFAVHSAAPHTDSSSSSCGRRNSRSWLSYNGVPVLHDCQLSFQQQQQQRENATYYHVKTWQATWCANLGGLWSEYYKTTARQPENTELAPWVLQRYRKYTRLSERLKRSSSSSSSNDDDDDDDNDG